ncbi:MAG: class I SAM-dependent rRNA methyltransferase [Verrucomicrobiales bacterium]|jgi:23S rRNA (cytosine1962-C5)-methyltransferase|nr:class I SAM-dependent rRNA methyltransferase [Verrucomicrobiales bacterium]
MKPSPAPPTLRLRVTPAAETKIRQGHPWVFDGSVRAQNRPGVDGELAAVFDRHDQFLAVGLYDAHSPIRLRVLHHGKPARIDAAWFAENLARSLSARAGLADAATDGLRLVNGENDHWPGLVLDRYADVLVLKIYTAAWFPRLPLLVNLLNARLPHRAIVLRHSRNIRHDEYRDGMTLSGPPVTAPVIFHEHGLKFHADVACGQKTGFFLDQRDNRRRVGQLAAGRAVLNVFSHTGGFSLHAARGGARAVTSVDLSPRALAELRDNWRLNVGDATVRACPHEEIQADAFDWLARERRRYSLIILDPPSLARREADRPAALRAYQRLARAGLRLLADGGILVCASCTAHINAEEFINTIRATVTASGKPMRELALTAHAPDHPVTVRELAYLKAVFLQHRAPLS